MRTETEEQVRSILGAMPRERASLLPALWAVVDKMGWVDQERLEAVAVVLNLPTADVYGVASFYAMLPTDGRTQVRVCNDVLCHLAGSQHLMADLRANGLDAVSWPCLGRCDQAPAALVNQRPVVQATAEKVQRAAQGGA